MAGNLDAQGKYAKAQPLYERALAIRRRRGARTTLKRLSAITIGRQPRCPGQVRRGQPLYERALAIWRKARGEDHPETAIGYNNLAASLYDQGKYAEAQPLYERRWPSGKCAGEDHPDKPRASTLAANVCAQGQHAEVRLGLEAGADSRLKVPDKEHVDTAELQQSGRKH